MVKQQLFSVRVTFTLIVLVGTLSCIDCTAFCRPSRLLTNSKLNTRNTIQKSAFIYESILGLRAGDDQVDDMIVQDHDEQEQPDLITDQDSFSNEEQDDSIINDIVTPPSIESMSKVTNKQKKLDFAKTMTSSMIMIPLASFSKFYTNSITTAPIITKSMTAGIVFILSDLLAQKLQQQRQQSKDKSVTNDTKIVWNRIIAAGIIGFAYYGPAAHFWYENMFKLIPSKTLYGTLQKAALGQLIFGPIFNCIFFASTLVQSKSFTISKWFSKIQSDLPSVILAGIGFWPFVDVISYTYIPPAFIPLFINFCSLLWTTYLALKSYA